MHVTFDYGRVRNTQWLYDRQAGNVVPNEGEECIVVYKNYRFTVLEVNDNTIQRVKIEKLLMA